MINLIKKGKNGLVKIKILPALIVLGMLFPIIYSCNARKVIYTPRGYDITEPEEHNLGSKLDEISGICWINDTLMLANNDESGKIFAINLSKLDQLDYRTLKFGPKQDYEDIVKVDSVIYVLVSDGQIIKLSGYQSDTTIQSSVAAVLPGTENEFETLYYDKDINSLIMLCKDCHKEKKTRSDRHTVMISKHQN